jgi:hypothetical protein
MEITMSFRRRSKNASDQVPPPVSSNKKQYVKFFLIGISILIAILIAYFIFFENGNRRKNDAKFKEILPAENGAWSDYLDPNLSVGCSGDLGSNTFINNSNFTHQDEFSKEDGVDAVNHSGSVRTVVDPLKNIMYVTVNTSNPDGELGYIQLRDNEDHNKPPLFEKKTYSKETKFQVTFNDQLKKEIFEDKIYIEYYSKFFSLRGFANRNSGVGGYLDNLSRCLTTTKVPTIKILSPEPDEQWQVGETHELKWEIHYPPGVLFNIKKMATTIYIYTDDGLPVGAIAYDGKANEGGNEISWNINNMLTYESKNSKYTLQFMVNDLSSNTTNSMVRYNIASIDGVVIQNSPTVTSQ